MRTFLSALLAVAAVLLASAAFCSAWLSVNVVSESGFTALAEPLGSDEPFQKELSQAIAAQAAQSSQVPEPFAALVEPVITQAVQGVQQLPGYSTAWTQTLERSHALSVGADGTAVPVALDLTPLVQLVTTTMGEELGVEIPDPDQAVLELAGTAQGENIQRLVSAAEAWPLLALAAAAAAVLALLVARRRSTTLALIGAGVLAAGVLFWAGARMLPEFVAQQQLSSPVASAFAAAFSQEASGSVQIWATALMIGAAVVLVLGLLFRALAGNRR